MFINLLKQASKHRRMGCNKCVWVENASQRLILEIVSFADWMLFLFG